VDNKENKWILNEAGVRTELLKTVKAKNLAYYGHTTRKERKLSGKRDNARNNAGEEDHAQCGWTASRHGQDSPTVNRNGRGQI